MSEENFAEMFAQSEKKRPHLPKPGDKVTASVVSVGHKHAVLDLGDGVDGMIELISLETAPNVGDRIDGYVLSVENRVVNVARAVAKGQSGMRVLEQAKETRLPVEGVVSAVNKGGYVVDAAGVRCFCPLGQMDLRRIDDPNVMIGKRLQFVVTEVKGRDAVVSRRALLELEQKDKRDKTLAALKVGARLVGTIANVRDFGAFVDLGGIDGLIPVSEMAWARVNAAEIVQVGQQVEVEVLRIEGELDSLSAKPKITLSMKALQTKPEEPKKEVIPLPDVGSVVECTVDRIESFGLFVTFKGGRGLVPGSELGDNLRKRFPVGSTFKAALVEVRPDGKMRLSKKAAEGAEERADADAFMKQQASAQQGQTAGFGSLADKLQKALKK